MDDPDAEGSGMSVRRVAFYAPLKPPNHPSPSGEREMARLLMAALKAAGCRVSLVSDLRVYLKDRDDGARHAMLHEAAEAERARIADVWAREGVPDLWVSYHPYYKSPDLLGPPLCRAHGVPWVTVEASQSARRSVGAWADFQARALDAAQGAAVNIALTARDEEGLFEIDPGLRVVRLAPFIDAGPFLDLSPRPEPGHLVAVAMMRAGDKLRSYEVLAEALRGLDGLRLSIVGDGPARGEVEAMYRGQPGVQFLGQLDRAGVREVLSRAAAFAWPGCGEAFGIAYLEAQAAGVPVVALKTAGVPEVVADGETGLLAADPVAFAAALERVASDDALRTHLAEGARKRVRARHDLPAAAAHLSRILDQWVRG